MQNDGREGILHKIDTYRSASEGEELLRVKLAEFIRKNPDCFQRSLQIGHITGSAWIVDPSFQCALLTHHTKLDKWLQLGGHSDGDPDTLQVAWREAQEESGLKSVHPHSEDIFDIDIHTIPERNAEPEHLHYDIRFLFIADQGESLTLSSESKDLQWINLENIAKRNPDESIIRMVRKTILLREG